MLASVGSIGDTYHNALAESFVDSLKTELTADRVWRTRSQLEPAVVEYIGWFQPRPPPRSAPRRPTSRMRGALRSADRDQYLFLNLKRGSQLTGLRESRSGSDVSQAILEELLHVGWLKFFGGNA